MDFLHWPVKCRRRTAGTFIIIEMEGSAVLLLLCHQDSFLYAPDDMIFRTDVTKKQGRGRVVAFIIFKGFSGTLIGIAISASIWTCIIGANIAAFDTVTAFSHPFVPELLKCKIIGPA